MNRLRQRAGASLVDVLMALLVLTILALSTGVLGTHGRGRIALQRHRQAALALAQGRLEEARAAPFTALRPALTNQTPYFLSVTGGAWSVSAADPHETRLVNKRTFAMTTVVRWVDADGGSPSLDALRITVTVPVRSGAGDDVVLETWRGPGS